MRDDGTSAAAATTAGLPPTDVLQLVHAVMQRERAARESAEAQQHRLIDSLKTLQRQSLSLAAQLDQAYLETITCLARAVEARDHSTGQHVERVRLFSVNIAERMGISGDDRRHVEFGALLHDIGKIGVPDMILSKRGPLTPDEWQIMRRHPQIGRQVLSGIAFLAPSLDAVLSHHERWDGTGYPNGLRGDAIPLAGQIVAVADAFDAMTADRPYRKGLSPEAGLAELVRHRGTQFSPQIVDAFLECRQAQTAQFSQRKPALGYVA